MKSPIPNIIRTQVVIDYSQNIGIRKQVFGFEESLSDFFKAPFLVLAIPDNYDPEISRFEALSHHGHSTLKVSQVRTSIITIYDDQFRSNPDEINQYLKERLPVIQGLLSQENIQSIGLIVELAFTIPNEEINALLKENTGARAIDEETIDFGLFYARPYKDTFYLLVTSAKYVQVVIKKGAAADTNYGVKVTLDINTKYHLNKGNPFIEKFYEDILSVIFDLINKNKLENYLKGEIK